MPRKMGRLSPVKMLRFRIWAEWDIFAGTLAQKKGFYGYQTRLLLFGFAENEEMADATNSADGVFASTKTTLHGVIHG